MKKEMGFALMKADKHREISSMGGKAVPAEKRTFFNSQIASEAGKKGAAARIAKAWEAKKHLLEK